MNDLSPAINNNTALSSSRSGLPNTTTEATAVALKQVNETIQPDAARAIEKTNRTPPDEQKVKQAVDDANRALQESNRQLQFSLDEDSGRSIVKVIDGQTDEVIRSFPSEEMLSISKFIQDNINQLGELDPGILLQAQG